MILTITKENSAAFENLVPPELLYPPDTPGRYCLGALRQDGEGSTAAGVLVFEVVEDAGTGVPVTAAVIRWLYVAQESRRLGMADALMEELYRVLNAAGVGYVRCDVPFPEEYNLLCAFLESWGLTFGLTDSYEITAALCRFASHPSFGQKPQTAFVRRVGDLEDALWRTVVGKAEKCEGRPPELATDKEAYDNDVSCAWVDGRMVTALFLVRRDGGGRLIPVLLRNFGEGGAQSIYALLCFAMHTAMEKYGPDVPVHVECLTKEAADLIAYFFPGAQPPLVRRGVYTGEAVEEAQ